MSRNVVAWRPQPIPPETPPQVWKLTEKPERRNPHEYFDDLSRGITRAHEHDPSDPER